MRWCLLLLVLLPAGVVAQTRSASLDSQPVARLEVNQPTAIIFPEAIGGLAIGYSPDVIDRRQDGPYLFLQPKDAVAGVLFVVSKGGTLYTLHYKTEGRPDRVLRLTATSAPAATTSPRLLDRWSFLRHLRLRTAIPGQALVDMPLPAMPTPQIRLLDHAAVRLKETVGLVMTVQNISPELVVLDPRIGLPLGEVPATTVALQAWGWPPTWRVCGVHIEAPHETADGLAVLEPAGLARLHILLEPTPHGCQ